MIRIHTVIYIFVSIFTLGGAIVGFFNMQTRQNMKIEQLEEKCKEIKKDLGEQIIHQIETEKAIISIGEKLDMLLDNMKELKINGCGKNCN